MERGQHSWWTEPPWLAWVVIVAGVVFLLVGTPLALQRGVGSAEGQASADTDAAQSTSAAATPAPTPFQPPTSATLLDDFTGRAGDTIDTATTGQPWTRTGSNPLILDDPGMTIDGTGAGYTTTDLGATPTSVGASVVFEKGRPGAVATLLVSRGPGLDLDNMGVHYYFDSTGWTIQVREHGETPFPTLRAGKFNPPLKTDGTAYTANVAVSGNTLTITNADGSVVTVTDPRIGGNLSGNVAWEVFRTAADQEVPVFQRVWATTGLQ